MTDLAITKACAEAMGFTLATGKDGFTWCPELSRVYDPLHDDAQAMALVKKFGLDIANLHHSTPVVYYVGTKDGAHRDMNLNRAICECVAKMSVRTPTERSEL